MMHGCDRFSNSSTKSSREQSWTCTRGQFSRAFPTEFRPDSQHLYDLLSTSKTPIRSQTFTARQPSLSSKLVSHNLCCVQSAAEISGRRSCLMLAMRCSKLMCSHSSSSPELSPCSNSSSLSCNDIFSSTPLRSAYIFVTNTKRKQLVEFCATQRNKKM